MNSRSKRIYIIAGSAGLLAVIAMIFFVSGTDVDKSSGTSAGLYPVSSFTHGHGLSVDVSNPSKLYVATHHGLFVLINDTELYRVGRSSDDYMGFSTHPYDSDIIYTSGHPAGGGNLGVQTSNDGGLTWRKISNGVGGPVDFHAMAVSPANPDLMFGWYQGRVQRSIDGGRNWEIVSTTDFPILSLVADPKNENILFATSPYGLFVSDDKGAQWKTVEEFGGDSPSFVSALAIDPKNPQNILTFSGKLGLTKSNDGGVSWESIGEGFNSETLLYIAFDRQNPDTVYGLTEKNIVFKSNDGGDSWEEIRR